MRTLLTLIPVLAFIAALVVYKHNGKRELLRLDLVQFFYAFVLMPVFYVWLKSFLFFFLESQLHQVISQSALLFWDTVYSVLFMFLYAFVVIHSLTKSFELKRTKDPLYDLFEHSEYYHSWVTHITIFVIGMIISFLLAILNAWLDLPWVLSQFQFYAVLVTAMLVAGIVFKAVLISDFGDFRFVKLMKLLAGIFFILHVAVGAIYDTPFSSEKAMYWYQFTVFLSLSTISLIHDQEPADLPFLKRLRKKVGKLTNRLLFRITND